MTFNELSLEEQNLILNSRLDKLNLNIHAGSCELTAINLTKDDNKVALGILDKYSDKQILLTLSNDQLHLLYQFIKNRYSLIRQLSKVQETLNKSQEECIEIEDYSENEKVL